MQVNQHKQWVEMVEKLTLARSILGTALIDIDDIVSEINAGRSELSEQSAKILTNTIQILLRSLTNLGTMGPAWSQSLPARMDAIK